MNQVKVILEALKSKDDFGAWFVSLDGLTIHDVSEDGGGGEHAGYLWATETEERRALFGLTAKDAHIIRQYFLDPDEMTWVEPSPEDQKQYMGYASLPHRFNQADFIRVIKKIYDKFIRVVFVGFADSALFVTVKTGDTQTHHKLLEFLIKENLPATKIWVDTYDEKAIWSAIEYNKIFETDSFSDIIEPELKRYRNYYFNESKIANTQVFKENNMNQYKAILEALQITESFTKDEAKQIGDELKIDWDKIDLDQFHKGLNVELEHGKVDSETNVTNDNKIKTAKIALAHLKEVPDYYTKLKKVEK